MQARFMKRAVVGAVGAVAMLIAGAAHAALQDRDLDGDTVVDAFYDTDLDITWLRDANVNGLMDWTTAVAWAGGYSFGGYSDWRLPASDESFCFCAVSEMGHLWYVELGNSAGGPMTNTGNFQSLLSDFYWSGTSYAPAPGDAWFFNFNLGSQDISDTSHGLYALAVRPGDVAAVPEPQSYAMLLFGLIALAVARRRRPH